MAFLGDTKVLTKSGWKKIENIGGRDKVLVRNFLGDAQFTQPFAIRKRDYSGKVISGGSLNYLFRVTPDHQIVYRDKHYNILKTTAEEVPQKRGTFLKHRSRYSTDTYLTDQKIRVGDYEYTIDTLDWYKFCGFVLRRGGIDRGRNRLIFTLDKENPKKDADLICPVLDRMRLEWNLSENILVISRKSNIANKTAFMLGSKKRKEMYVPDKMLYTATTEQGKALIDMFVLASRKDGEWNGKTIQFSTTNVKLIDSLEILGLLSGYTISRLLTRPAGSKVPKGVTKKDAYTVYVRNSVYEVSITNKEDEEYSGKVYEVDMFEDQLLIKEDECLPVWMKPK